MLSIYLKKNSRIYICNWTYCCRLKIVKYLKNYLVLVQLPISIESTDFSSIATNQNSLRIVMTTGHTCNQNLHFFNFFRLLLPLMRPHGTCAPCKTNGSKLSLPFRSIFIAVSDWVCFACHFIWTILLRLILVRIYVHTYDYICTRCWLGLMYSSSTQYFITSLWYRIKRAKYEIIKLVTDISELDLSQFN